MYNNFLNNKNIKYIFDIFIKHNEEIRLVGGCVRDLLSGNDVKDYDFATTAIPKKIIEICKKENIKYFDSGISHGTVTVMVDGEGFEITTLREDTDTDGRHANVAWVADWKKDATRRDCTFNAMYIDRNGFLYDYFNGQSDLKNKIVRFVGNADERIKEDALRILRYFRFVGRFSAFNYDQEAIDAIIENKELIKNLSVERIFSELTKIFNNHNQWIINEKMNDLGVSEVIFDKDIPIPNNVFFEPNYLITFAIIANGEIDYMRKFKASIDEIKFVNNVIKSPEITMFDDVFYITEYLLDYSMNVLFAKAILYSFNQNIDIRVWNNFVNKVKNTFVPIFPVRGQDFLNKGYKGMEIGKAMEMAKKLWIHSKFQISREKILEIV